MQTEPTSPKQAENKAKWIQDNLGQYNLMFLPVMKDAGENKGEYIFGSCIQIDDTLEDLECTKAALKIHFKNGKPVNMFELHSDSRLYRIDTWGDIIDVVEFYHQHPELLEKETSLFDNEEVVRIPAELYE